MSAQVDKVDIQVDWLEQNQQLTPRQSQKTFHEIARYSEGALMMA